MESADLKPNSPDDAQLEAWLRANAAAAPLPDDGFSARVLAALPPPRPAIPSRVLVCLAGGAAGAAVAIAQRPAWAGLASDWPALAPAWGNIVQALGQWPMLLALAITLASLAFVFWRGNLLAADR